MQIGAASQSQFLRPCSERLHPYHLSKQSIYTPGERPRHEVNARQTAMSNGATTQQKTKASTGKSFLSTNIYTYIYICSDTRLLTRHRRRLPLPRRPRLRLHNRVPPPTRRPAQNPRPAIPLLDPNPSPALDPRWSESSQAAMARDYAFSHPDGVWECAVLWHAE